jgi:hypothetical protein
MKLLAPQFSSPAVIGIFHFGEDGLIEGGNFCCHINSQPFLKRTHFRESRIFIFPIIFIGFVVASNVNG